MRNVGIIERTFKTTRMKKSNNEADSTNPNKGTSGTNKTYDKAQGNRCKQLNPNQRTNKKD